MSRIQLYKNVISKYLLVKLEIWPFCLMRPGTSVLLLLHGISSFFHLASSFSLGHHALKTLQYVQEGQSFESLRCVWKRLDSFTTCMVLWIVKLLCGAVTLLCATALFWVQYCLIFLIDPKLIFMHLLLMALVSLIFRFVIWWAFLPVFLILSGVFVYLAHLLTLFPVMKYSVEWKFQENCFSCKKHVIYL